MVFILYKLYVLLPYTYPTPKLSPHRRLCAFQLSPKKPHSVWFISVLKSGDMGQCPEKSPSPCNTCVIPVSLYKSMSWFVTKTRTHTHTHTLTSLSSNTHTHSHPWAQTHTHTHTPLSSNTHSHPELKHTNTHSHPWAQTHKHTHTHTLTPLSSNTHTHTLTPLSSNTQTHTHTPELKHTHTHRERERESIVCQMIKRIDTLLKMKGKSMTLLVCKILVNHVNILCDVLKSLCKNNSLFKFYILLFMWFLAIYVIF